MHGNGFPGGFGRAENATSEVRAVAREQVRRRGVDDEGFILTV
jgi:hypothetical protein